MVNIREKKTGEQTYYYLEHSVRKGSKIIKKEKYLGKEIPKDIERIKRAFIIELYNKKWFNDFENIKSNYSKEQKIMPHSSKTKQKQTFSVKFTYSTQKIEGSSLSLKDTSNLIERGITPSEKPINDVVEAEEHNKVFYEMLSYQKDLSLLIILYWHKKLFEKTKPDTAGIIRNHQVGISLSKYTPPMPSELYFLIREFFDWYNKSKNNLNPVELSALVHLKWVTIHPFADGNGRISRLMMNFVLHKHGYPMLDISYTKRNSYYTSLERSQVKKDDSPFINWFFKRYIKDCENYSKL